MIRIVIENIVLFLLPTLMYVAWMMLKRRGKIGAGDILDDAPLIWLFAAGAGLVVVTILVFGSSSGGRPGQVYTPPVFRDGKIEPGQLR
jgi:hypothetical protein